MADDTNYNFTELGGEWSGIEVRDREGNIVYVQKRKKYVDMNELVLELLKHYEDEDTEEIIDEAQEQMNEEITELKGQLGMAENPFKLDEDREL